MNLLDDYVEVGARFDLHPVELVEEMHEMQQDFEEFRASRIPVEERRVDGFCDENIGRICIWFGGDENETFPAEFREVGQARVELIRSLTDAFQQIRDRWILGQVVHYLVERVEFGEAERLADVVGAGNCYINRNMVGAVVGVGVLSALMVAAVKQGTPWWG